MCRCVVESAIGFGSARRIGVAVPGCRTPLSRHFAAAFHKPAAGCRSQKPAGIRSALTRTGNGDIFAVGRHRENRTYAPLIRLSRWEAVRHRGVLTMPRLFLCKSLLFFLVAFVAGCDDGLRQRLTVGASADPAAVKAGERVTLSGTARNAGRRHRQFCLGAKGRRRAGVALSGADSASATFTAPATVGTLTFRLTVTDGEGAAASAEVTVRVERFVSVSAGASHTCWVRATGTVACWGDNSEGQSIAAGRPVCYSQRRRFPHLRRARRRRRGLLGRR